MTPLAEAGATLADSVADVAAADIISVTVLNDEQVREVVGELAANAKPGTVDRHSLDDQPRHRRRTRRTACSRRAFTSSTRRSAVAAGSEQGRAGVMVGADRRGVRAASRTAFKQWASLVVHAGEPGAGTRMKLARNMLTSSRSPRPARRSKLAEAAGMNLQDLGQVVRHSDAQSGGAGRDHGPRRHEAAGARTTSCMSHFSTRASSARRT